MLAFCQKSRLSRAILSHIRPLLSTENGGWVRLSVAWYAVGMEGELHVAGLLGQLALLLALGWVLSPGARRMGMPLWIGALAGGLLLGPTVLGHAWPAGYGYLAGAAEVQHEIDRYVDQRQTQRDRLEAINITEVAVLEFDEATEARLDELRTQRERRLAEGRASLFHFLLFGGAGLIALLLHPRRGRAMMADAMPVGMAGGLTAAVLAAAAGWVLLASGRVIAETPTLTLAALGVAATAGLVAPRFHAPAAEPDDPVADARLLTDATGQVMLYLMLIGVIAVAGVMNVWLGAAMLVFLAGLAWFARLPAESPAWSQGATWLGCAIAGLIGLQVDLAGGFDWLAVLLLWIACGDGRAAGALVGARFLANRSWQASWRVALGSYPGGPVALFVAALAAAAGLIDPRLFASLVIAQVLTAILARPAERIITDMTPME